MNQRLLLPLYISFCCAFLPLLSWFNGHVHNHSTTSRRLVLVLDGVPYETIAELTAEGRFARFHQPARMVSTVPSLTNPAMVKILLPGRFGKRSTITWRRWERWDE